MENFQHFSRVLKGLELSNLSQVFKNIWPKMHEKHHKGLRILVTGKSSQGKSALINGLLGAKVALEGARGRPELSTKEVMAFSTTVAGVPIKVFDSPGLQDITGNEAVYIQNMIDQCQGLSLVLYCTKMTDTRLTVADKNAMMTLTKSFGENFWNYAVFVLTFANMEDVERRDSRDLDGHLDQTNVPESIKKQRFENRLKIWQHSLYEFLMSEVGVNADIAISIPVVPTGDRKKTRRNRNPLRLPGRDNWFRSFWEVCCLRIKETSLFLEINNGRMVDITGKLPSIQEEEEEQSSTPTKPKNNAAAGSLDDSISSVFSASEETNNDDSITSQQGTPQQQTPMMEKQKSNNSTSEDLDSQAIQVRYRFVRDVTGKLFSEGYIDEPDDIEVVKNAFGKDLLIPKRDAVPQLGDVVRQLAPIAYQWNEIGLYLNVQHGVLMSQAHNTNATDIVRLGNTIQSWLDSTVTPSWNTLLSVVESDLKNMRLGMDIRHFLSSYSS